MVLENGSALPSFWCRAFGAGLSASLNFLGGNTQSRVTTEKGEVIKGLYAVGNLGGQFYGAPDYPFFHPGLSLGHAVTFGYIAGEHAAQNL